jgi:hypothetical protein
MNLWRVEGGKLRLRLHEGQARAWRSERRFVFVLAGTQGGKTSFGPWWLAHEIKRRGAGDYLAVTATYDLFKLKMLPALRETFEHLLRIGRYWSSDRIIELADPATGEFRAKRADDPMWGRIILRSADAKGGLESSSARAAWLDEAGMDNFTVDEWQAVLRRLSLAMGRVLATTTIYNLGWIKGLIYDRWKAGDPDIEVVQFDSTLNPSFPREEYERARDSMPLWKFNMFYRGLYERPAGLIYDSFSDDDVVPRFAIPHSWPRHLGLDFGGVNTAGLFIAAEPSTTNLYLYREYKAGGRTAAEHSKHLLEGEPAIPNCVGGSHSEGQWRDEFRAGGVVGTVRVPGIPVREPDIKDVHLGIDRVYGAHKRHEIKVFADLGGYLAEKRSYSYEVDALGEVKEPLTIRDKHAYHFMDAERYIVGWLRRGTMQRRSGSVGEKRPPPVAGGFR